MPPPKRKKPEQPSPTLTETDIQQLTLYLLIL